jgi:hypothetical protein
VAAAGHRQTGGGDVRETSPGYFKITSLQKDKRKA